MELTTAIESRRSIRRFKFASVKKEDLYYIVQLALCAPSAGNLQDYQFIVCTNKDMIQELPAMCMDQAWIDTAPAVIVVCSQPQEQNKWYGPAGDVFARQGASAAVQNILLSAHDLGLGACWIGGFDNDQVSHLFGVPEDVRIEAIIPIGYPDEEPEEIIKKEFVSTMFFDKYGVDLQDLELSSKEFALLRDRKLRHAKKHSKSKISSFVNSMKSKLSSKDDEEPSSEQEEIPEIKQE